MRIPATPFINTIILLIALLSMISCSEETTPEDQIRAYIKSAETAAEERSINDFKDLISEQFTGKNQYNKQTIGRMAAGYFFQNKNIHILTNIKSIYFPHPNQAEVQVVAAMAGQAITDVNLLINLRAKVYQFDLLLFKEDDQWLLRNARWSPAKGEDLFD